MKLTCFEVDRRLLDLAAGELSFRERAGVRAHLVACARCRRAFGRLGDLLGEFPVEPLAEVPERLREETLEILRREGVSRPSPEGKERGIHLRVPAYAMGLIVALSVGYGLLGGADLETRMVPQAWKLADSTLQVPDSVFNGSSLDTPESTSVWPRRDDMLRPARADAVAPSGSTLGIERRLRGTLRD